MAMAGPLPLDCLLIGASVRAAAWSAVRAGLRPACVDLFGDADTLALGPTRVIRQYPAEFVQASREFSKLPVVYTGGLENHPEVLAQLRRRLWGNSPEVVTQVRSPELLRECLAAHAIRCPAIAQNPPVEGRWLLKSRRSAAGMGVQWFAGQRVSAESQFLQEYLDGEPCSAVYWACGAHCYLLGVTRQRLASPFLYAGSIGPLDLPPTRRAAWEHIGATLVKCFRLQGLFGVDAVVRDGIPCPVEANPRYTASLEVLERAFHAAFFRWHCEAFREPRRRAAAATEVRAFAQAQPRLDTLHGKAIYYAKGPLRFPTQVPPGDFADLPHAGTLFQTGQPVLTHFCTGPTVAECERRLGEMEWHLDQLFASMYTAPVCKP